MHRCDKFFIDGSWVAPRHARFLDIVDPSSGRVSGQLALGGTCDVDRAVAAAREAFDTWSTTSRDQRLVQLRRIREAFHGRIDDLAQAISLEMGAPLWLAKRAQAGQGIGHIDATIKVLEDFAFELPHEGWTLVREPIGVCGLITPWNWPINQIAAKVLPALAAGCTVILKPSELAPYSAIIWTEILQASGLPAGVFNLVHGDGPTVGAALAAHADIDLISFTGSTRAGIEVARTSAPTVKRVLQELGGKSPHIVLPDADLAVAVPNGVRAVMLNSGQTCSAPTRMLVPRQLLNEVEDIARTAAEATTVGPPASGAFVGPLANRAQFDKVSSMIKRGIGDGAKVVAGGPGRPEGLTSGFFVRPTIFSGVTHDMTIGRDEIFGPVLAIIPYDDVDHAVALANDTEYGLSAHVSGTDPRLIASVSRRLRAGQVIVNFAAMDFMAPFGGYKKSGNGREWGGHALLEFLEIKAIVGDARPEALVA